MADGNESSLCSGVNCYCVQIPLWPMVTLPLRESTPEIFSSNSSMADGNESHFVPSAFARAVQIPLWPMVTKKRRTTFGHSLLFKFLYGRW